jgi:hypothetical protein
MTTGPVISMLEGSTVLAVAELLLLLVQRVWVRWRPRHRVALALTQSSGGSLIILGHLEAAVDLGLERHGQLLTLLVLFDGSHLFPIFHFLLLHLPQVISDLHLLFNQVLSLGKTSNELLPLFLLQTPSLSLADPVSNLKQLFLLIKLLLLLYELLPEQPLLIVEIDEYL